MNATAEAASEKLIAEAHEYLVQCGEAAVQRGSYCTITVALTYKGGTVLELAKTQMETTVPKK